jgi:hypothetical protein
MTRAHLSVLAIPEPYAQPVTEPQIARAMRKAKRKLGSPSRKLLTKDAPVINLAISGVPRSC